jgi:hypothetical protein
VSLPEATDDEHPCQRHNGGTANDSCGDLSANKAKPKAAKQRNDSRDQGIALASALRSERGGNSDCLKRLPVLLLILRHRDQPIGGTWADDLISSECLSAGQRARGVF